MIDDQLGWLIFWAVTLYCSIVTAGHVIHDRNLNKYGVAIFLATPVLWAVALVFFF